MIEESHHYAINLSIAIALLSCCTTILQLYVTLKLLPRLTGFLILITSLAMMNILYDISYLFRIVPPQTTSWGNTVYLYSIIFTDTAMGLWTNLLSSILFRIVRTLKAVEIHVEYRYYLLLTLSLPMFLIIFLMTTVGWNLTITCLGFRIYYWIRISIIGFNVIKYCLTKIYLRRLPDYINKGKLTKSHAKNIEVIIKRMRYYALVQVITRLGPCWQDYNSNTSNDTAPIIIANLCAPTVGIGYCLIFFYLQPNAWDSLKQKVLKRYCPLTLFDSMEDKIDDCSRPSGWGGGQQEEEIEYLDDEEIMNRIPSGRFPQANGGTSSSASSPANVVPEIEMEVINPIV